MNSSTTDRPDAPTSDNAQNGPAVNEPVLNIAAYRFVQIDDIPSLRRHWQVEANDLGLRGTILLSPEGVNMFLAGKETALRQFLCDVQSDSRFSNLEIKESWTDYQPFNRMLVRPKKEIISFGVDDIDPASRTSPKLSAGELKKWLDDGRKITLLDTRNEYETELGTFKNAVDLKIDSFRDFIDAAKTLPDETKKEPVVMFCTGGIRCEKAGPYMESLGFEEIYQLDGGILKYFEEIGSEHYDGDCFVFDQRVAVKPNLQPSGHKLCFACQATLSTEDIESEYYEPAVSCPHCYQSPEQVMRARCEQREQQLSRLAAEQPGSTAYVNERAIHVPRKYHGLSALDFLTSHAKGYDDQQWSDEFNAGRLSRDGRVLSADTAVSEGQKIIHSMPGTVEPRINPDIRVLFEDDAYLVLNKPAPLPMHPCGRFNKNTLQSILRNAFAPQKIRLVHRLDANTSGIVVVCKKYAAARHLQKQFANRTVEKTYLAELTGHPSQDHWTCNAAITRDTANSAGARIVPMAEEGAMNEDDKNKEADPAETAFEVIERRRDTTLVKVTPVTGRTNQIRIHAWCQGLPIVGDPLYLPGQLLGDSQTLPVNEQLENQAMRLHAVRIRFLDIEQQPVEVMSDLPIWANEIVER